MTEKTKPRTSVTPVQNKDINPLWIVVGIFGIICMCMFAAMSQFFTTDNKPKDHSIMASIQCKNFVKDSLKSPSSAEFPMSKGQNIGSNTYVVNSYVDADNVFGAKLRKNFSCKIKYTGGDEDDKSNWNLIDLNIDE
jgi:hypothetical protein